MKARIERRVQKAIAKNRSPFPRKSRNQKRNDRAIRNLMRKSGK